MSEDWLDMFPEACQTALPKPLSDHCPVLLDTQCERWGPSPFCFEPMWLEEKDLFGLIKDWWGNCSSEGKPGFVPTHKIKEVKLKIKGPFV